MDEQPWSEMKTYDDNDVKVELVFLTAMKLVLMIPSQG